MRKANGQNLLIPFSLGKIIFEKWWDDGGNCDFSNGTVRPRFTSDFFSDW